MDPSRSKSRGVELLRAFLEFAASGGASLGDEGALARDAFEADVHAALAARGVPLTPRFGVGGYRLDLAAAHPSEPGRFVLAIEFDGPTYHAAPTARDRDRLRPQQLEALGWRVHRIWSTDWLRHRDREIEAAVRAWEGATIPIPPAAHHPDPSPAIRREPPPVARRDDIEEIPPGELDALVRWLREGGVRTDDEIVEEAIDRLGYARRGAKIVRTLLAAVERTRPSPP